MNLFNVYAKVQITNYAFINLICSSFIPFRVYSDYCILYSDLV